MAEQSLLDVEKPAGETVEGDAAAAAAAEAERVAAEAGGPGERPDYIPEGAWGEKGFDKGKFIELVRAETRPETADLYELPETIEGVDMEQAKASPLLAGLRLAAHEAGLDQESFGKVASQMLAEGARLAGESVAAETKKLGDNAGARITALNAWLGTALPANQAAAVAAMATTADAVAGLETLMKTGTRKAGDTGGGASTARKTKAEIEAMMATPAYSGKASERDPKVIAEVDAWFVEEAKKPA